MTPLQKIFKEVIGLAASAAIALLSLAPAPAAAQTIVNGRLLTERQQIEFQLLYGTAPAVGSFWYDTRTGMWGIWGREVAGLLKPGHNYGPLSPYASNGHTGIFINGRQLNQVEAAYFFGAQARPARLWADGFTGNFGLEGNPVPLGNVANMMRARSPRRPLYSGSELMGGASNSAGTCTAAGNCYYPGQ